MHGDDCTAAAVYFEQFIHMAVNFEHSSDHCIGSVINLGFYSVSLISLVLNLAGYCFIRIQNKLKFV